MGDVSLEDILVTHLKRIPTVGGDVLHGMRPPGGGGGLIPEYSR